MLIHIANYFEADRRSAVAGEDMALGCVTVASPDGTGQRELNKLTAQNEIKPGIVGIAFKVSADPLQVSSSTVSESLGDRSVSIKAGDQIVEVRVGAMVEYDVSLLDDSLNPGATVPGTLPDVGDALAINPTNSKFCKSDVSGALTAPVFGRVFEVRGSKKVVVELVTPDLDIS